MALTGSFQHQVQQVYDALVKKGLKPLAQKWKSFASNMHKQFPKLNVQQIFEVFSAQYLAQGLGQGVSKAISATAQATSVSAQGAAKAAENITQTFDHIGAALASAIEGGFIAVFKDVWDVIIGPWEVLIGAVIIIMALFLASSDKLIGLAGAVR